MSEFEDPWRLRSSAFWGLAAMARRAAARGASIGATAVSAPRWTPPFRPYAYNGTGRDTLTAWMDDEPQETDRLTRRQERIETLATLPLHLGPEPVPPPGYFTTAQAAEMLGVTQRTIERYKRELRREDDVIPADFGDFVIGCGPALVMTIIVLGGILLAIQGIRLILWARRGFRLLDELTGRGDGQGGIPPTRAMNLGGLAIPAHDGHITDRTATQAITLDPDPALGCPYCAPPFDPAASCTCSRPCGDQWCGYLQWLQAGRQA